MKKIEVTKEQSDLIKGISHCVNGEWYYIPYWFKDLGNNVFEEHSFDKLPDELKDVLMDSRYKQSDRKDFQTPLRPEDCDE